MENVYTKINIFSSIMLVSSLMMLAQDIPFIQQNEYIYYISGRVLCSASFLLILSINIINKKSSKYLLNTLIFFSMVYTLHGFYFRQGYFLAFLELILALSALFEVNKKTFYYFFFPFILIAILINSFWHSESYNLYTLNDLLNDQLFGIIASSIFCLLIYLYITNKNLKIRRIELKNIDIGQYASTIVHDLKGFLSGPVFYLDLLERTATPAQLNHVKKIKEEMEFIQTFIKEINQMSTLTKNEHEIFSTNEIIETIKLLNTVNFVNIDFETHGNNSIKTNKNYFLRTLFNMVKNSIESLKENKIEHGSIQINIENNKLIFKDNGPGFPEQILKALNKGELIVSSKKEGSGFGLSIIQNFLKEIDIPTKFYNQQGAVIELDLSKVSV